jgi:hypothetical protein
VPDDDSIVRPVVRSLDPLWFPPDNVPTDLNNFGCLVYLLIGSSEIGGVDKFHCFACSPRWLADKLSGIGPPPEHGMFLDRSNDDQIIFGSGLVLMNTWSLSALRIAIDDFLLECEGSSWGVVANKIARRFPWEYHYRYDEYVNRHPEKFNWPGTLNE